MPITWINPRRPLTAILFISIIAVSLRTFVRRHYYTTDPPFELVDVDDFVESSFEWSNSEHSQSQNRPPLGKHTISPDGLLLVNPNGPHPIFQLIHDAEAAWDAKRARASKTLDEAVAEYRRRYRRAPPLGFDKWWDYVAKNRVLLPDEYDEIFEDIEPFWGIDPHELAHTQKELETRNGVVTLEKTNAHPQLQVVRSNLPEGRQRELQGSIDRILTLIREVEHDLPPLRMTFSAYDNPSMHSTWEIKNMALEAAANGTTLTRADIPPVTEFGWVQACPPNSPARLHPPTHPPPSSPLPPSSPKTFIASHRDTMNPCLHPSLLTSHGQFLSHKEGPGQQRTLVPRFSLCSTFLHDDIRPPVPYGWKYESDSDPDEDEDADGGGAFEGDVPWERKTNEKLGWRGRTTGMYATPDAWWTSGHRARLVTLTNALEGNVSVLRVPGSEIGSKAEADKIPVGEPESVLLSEVNPAWMDVAFTDKPVGCDEEGGTCEEMAQMWSFRDVQERQEEGRYKFILDVDGNGWSGRFKRLITSNALIFKATIYPEWYASRIMPWVHYIPIQISYVDLYDTVSFFRVHDDLARRIARAGRAWSRRYWRRADMTAYLYRLLLEYARVASLDREAMSYVG